MTDLNPFIGFLETPPLWKGTQFDITQFNFPTIDLKKFSPIALPRKIRLGHQMEHVCYQLLSQSVNYKILVHNLPVKDENRTIGEIDFIVQDERSKKLIHVELTYKFYLVDPTFSELTHQLIGPNRKDTFFRKMEKIRDKQFSLLHTIAGIKALKAYHIDHKAIVHQACFKTQLFISYESEMMNIAPFNSDCIVGFYINPLQLNTAQFRKFQYYLPSKSSWGLTPHDNVLWASHQEILPEINLKLKEHIAPMVWIKESRLKFEKCFVVWW